MNFLDRLARAFVWTGLTALAVHIALLIVYGAAFPPSSIWKEFVGLSIAIGISNAYSAARSGGWANSLRADERDHLISGRAAGLIAGFVMLTSAVMAMICMVSAIMPKPLLPNLVAWAGGFFFFANWMVFGLARILVSDRA